MVAGHEADDDAGMFLKRSQDAMPERLDADLQDMDKAGVNVQLVLVGGGHMVLWWGLWCYPTVRHTYAVLYYTCGALAVWAALRARTAVGRGLPMLALLLVRLSAFATRALLEPPGPALMHYAAMEVRAGAMGMPIAAGMGTAAAIPAACWGMQGLAACFTCLPFVPSAAPDRQPLLSFAASQLCSYARWRAAC